MAVLTSTRTPPTSAPAGSPVGDLKTDDLVRWASTTDADAVLAALDGRPSGLSQAEAAQRLARHGPNALPRRARRPWYVELGAEFVHFFALLLWAAAALAWLAGMPQLSWAVVAVVLINGVFSYWQEFQAERAAEALEAMLPRKVTVRRDGEMALLPSADVVPGDVLLLEEGEAVPADARLMEADRLRLDLSSLTGESRPVPRTAATARPDDLAAIEAPNVVFAGTTVAGGRGEAVVFATGGSTEFGRIARLTGEQREPVSPLEREIAWLTRVVTVLAIGLGGLFFVVGTALGGLSPTAAFVFALGVIVANVPEGLLPTLTLSLALGVRRMALRNALVKRLSSVGTLGTTTLILTDKTGTLTENEMTVREVWTADGSFRVSGVGYEPSGGVEPVSPGGDESAFREAVRAAALCCDAHLQPPRGGSFRWQVVGDPTEGAILVAAAKIGLGAEALAASPRLAEIPFDSVRKRMSTVQVVDGSPVICVKGAPSEVIPRCATIHLGGVVADLDVALATRAGAANDDLARRGLRVLAIATRALEHRVRTEADWRDEAESGLTLLGLLAMEDPPRPEVPRALAACRRAGIRVAMATGDYALTGAAIGREIGLFRGEPRVVDGRELDALDDPALDRILAAPDLLFARVTPEHKLRLVEAFQRRGDVVAVTGDGVNDAPALKRADIGVAMGLNGTDVARQAADMVLADDNFASIVAAIEEGRGVFDNVRKFVTYILASNVPELVPFLAFVLFHVPLPLTVMQILAVDLGTDLLPALGLGMEPPEPGVMDRPPRSRSERLITPPLLARAYGLGAIEAALSLSAFFVTFWLAGWRGDAALPDSGPLYMLATTMSLAGIVACQVGNVFACRSSSASIWALGFMTNRAVLFGVLAEIVLLVALVYAPPLAAVFGLAPLQPIHWLILAALGPTLLLLEELRKAWRRAGRHAPAPVPLAPV